MGPASESFVSTEEYHVQLDNVYDSYFSTPLSVIVIMCIIFSRANEANDPLSIVMDSNLMPRTAIWSTVGLCNGGITYTMWIEWSNRWPYGSFSYSATVIDTM